MFCQTNDDKKILGSCGNVMLLSDMREKLDGIRLTFRLSSSQTKLVERAMPVAKVSNVSEFVRQAVLNEAERILAQKELEDVRRKALKAQIERDVMNASDPLAFGRAKSESKKVLEGALQRKSRPTDSLPSGGSQMEAS